MRPVLLLLAVAGVSAAEVNPRELVRQSIANGDRSWKRARTYTHMEVDEVKKFGAGSSVKSTEVEKYEVMVMEGTPYHRLIERNGRPLSGAEKQREEQKLQKTIAQRRRESPVQKRRRIASYENERQFLREVPDAFEFKLIGEERLPAGEAYVLEATPRPGYQARSRYGKVMSKMRGKLWIDKKEVQWVKADAEATDTASLGWFVARLAKGSHIVLEQTRLADGVWVPSLLKAKASARIMLVKSEKFEENITYTNYRKTESS